MNKIDLTSSFDATGTVLAKQLGGNKTELLTARIKRTVNAIYSAASAELSTLKGEIESLEAKSEELMDLSPKSTTSLRIANDNFDASALWKEISDLTVEIDLKKAKFLSKAKVYNTWFAKADEGEKDNKE